MFDVYDFKTITRSILSARSSEFLSFESDGERADYLGEVFY